MVLKGIFEELFTYTPLTIIMVWKRVSDAANSPTVGAFSMPRNSL